MTQTMYSARELGNIVEQVLFLRQTQDQAYDAEFGRNPHLNARITADALKSREQAYDQSVPEEVKRELSQIALFHR